MFTIKNDLNGELIVNKSRFITYVYKVNNVLEVNEKIDALKAKYKDATHYCYSYIIDNIKRFNDDKEPSHTAGMPILNVLESKNLNYVLAVVIRYFGGIKLGAGGLVRAYSNSITEALSKINYISLKSGYLIELTFDYKDQKNIDYILRNSIIKEQVFQEKIYYKALIKKELLESLSSYNLNIINEQLIEEDDNYFK